MLHSIAVPLSDKARMAAPAGKTWSLVTPRGGILRTGDRLVYRTTILGGTDSPFLALCGLPSLAPKILEPRRRQLGVAHRVLDVAVAEVRLQRSRVVSLVCQRITTGVPKHVRVRLETKLKKQMLLGSHVSAMSWARRHGGRAIAARL